MFVLWPPIQSMQIILSYPTDEWKQQTCTFIAIIIIETVASYGYVMSRCLPPVVQFAWCVGMNQSHALHRVFASHLCHSGQTCRFRCCSSAAREAFEYPKKNSRNGNKEELYFTFYSCRVIKADVHEPTTKSSPMSPGSGKIAGINKSTNRRPAPPVPAKSCAQQFQQQVQAKYS